jgi:hypothetical protein
VLGSGIGEQVLVATGSVASGYFAPEHPPLDALIIGSLDEMGPLGATRFGERASETANEGKEQR